MTTGRPRGRPRKDAEPNHEPINDLAERVRELEAALKPFAEHAARLRRADPRGAGRKIVYDMHGAPLTIAHFDAAIDAMERL